MTTFTQNLTPEEADVLKEVLLSYPLQNLIGAEEWDLSEDQEMVLWDIIDKAKGV